jgi:hypothetical protein
MAARLSARRSLRGMGLGMLACRDCSRLEQALRRLADTRLGHLAAVAVRELDAKQRLDGVPGGVDGRFS